MASALACTHWILKQGNPSWILCALGNSKCVHFKFLIARDDRDPKWTELRSPRIDGKWERPRLPCHFLTCCLQFSGREWAKTCPSYVPSMCSRRSQDARRCCINTCICATTQGSGRDADWTYVNEVPAGAVAGSQLSEIESCWYLKAAYQRVHLNYISRSSPAMFGTLSTTFLTLLASSQVFTSTWLHGWLALSCPAEGCLFLDRTGMFLGLLFRFYMVLRTSYYILLTNWYYSIDFRISYVGRMVMWSQGK